MSKIMYLPLDERPCNYSFPGKILRNSGIKLIKPKRSILGLQKKPASINKLRKWMKNHIMDIDILVVNIEMLLFGGLVPSRLHHKSLPECNNDLKLLKELKDINPSLKIFSSNMIMRVPAYNSAEEEPEYYKDYGEDIYKYGQLQDKIELEIAEEKELNKFEKIKEKLPQKVIKDYLNRRKINHEVNKKVIKLVEAEIIDFLIIPMDDNSTYGFSARERKKLKKVISNKNLFDRIYIYPGADEAGCTLVTRAYNEIKECNPKIYPVYASEKGKTTIPQLEDRSLAETVKYQIIAAGGIVIDNSIDCDVALMINPPTAVTQKNNINVNDNDYIDDPERNINEFVSKIEYFINKDISCSLADVAWVNYPDNDLLKLLKRRNLLKKITSYAAWNTSSNSLGTVIAHSMIAIDNKENNKYSSLNFLFERLLRDWGYQYFVRHKVDEKLDEYWLDYFDLGDKVETISDLIKKELDIFHKKYLNDFNFTYDIYLPWERLFEIGIRNRGE